MTNRTLYLGFIAFAAAAAMNANTNAQAEMPGDADLMQLIHEDLDAKQADFTLALMAKTEKKIAVQTAKIDNVFGPLTLADNVETVAKVQTANFDTSAKLDSLVLANAEDEVAKAAAKIENPFNPRLPMAPSIIAFANDEE
jgi:hypothetical protein